MEQTSHRNATLVLCTVLHLFTHAYQLALIPLYLMLREDLGLKSDAEAPLLVTLMGVAYFLPAYWQGILADHFSKKKLLSIGLAINGAAFAGLAFAQNYWQALVCVLGAGLGGSFFHPPATALVVGLFPEAPGKALGRLGVGASLGFFAGPLYSGWRAGTSGWRAPVLELGIAGLVVAGLFYWIAQEPRATPHEERQTKMFATPMLWVMFVAAALFFCLRDFAGYGMASLGSFFLQRAHDCSPAQTGLVLSCIYPASVISNPLFGSLSDRGRMRWTAFVLICAAVVVYWFPRLGPEFAIPMFLVYGFFLLSSYPIVEAALMESVHPSVRGRVFGLFITIGGFLGNFAHWIVGEWVKNLKGAATEPEAYFKYYNIIALAIIGTLVALLFLRKLKPQPKHAGAS